ncbi:MAG: aminotransferase class I/II-fold pyridoxal phosphate-dependent enzyme [Clostridia bacterium]|nr:aminotransferase class I/II-fold pyridoxal phosphate-dependent enzyme [Clostridia bacterium]
MDQNKTPLFSAIREYDQRRPSYFRIPGHRYENGIDPLFREAVGDGIFGFDLTETPLTDDLHNASGAIKEAEELAAELWGADYTHFLVNGTTCGNETAVMTCCGGGRKMAIPRNAHKSALMGLILGGGNPVYIMPGLEPTWGLHGGITPAQAEEMFEKNPDCKGLMVVSPTYFGVTSDIKGLAEVCHRHDAMLIVDEAHGAHCYFSDRLPVGGLAAGADIVCQSIHKVTGSFGQSSMLHVKSNLVDRNHLEANLHLVQSTSPSYLLLTSLDMARHDMAQRGSKMIDEALSLAQDARERINKIPGIMCAGREIIGNAGINDLDETRLTITAAPIGITGFDLKKMLFDEYNIDMEQANYHDSLAIVTFANQKEDLDHLVDALSDIAKRFKDGKELPKALPLPPHPEYVISPREAYFGKNRRVDWKDCKGKISAEMIAPYPPGIPVIYNGERMSEEVWEYLTEYKARKAHLQGPSDPSLDTLLIIDD